MQTAVAGTDQGARLRTGMAVVLLSAVLILGWQTLTQSSALGASPDECVASSQDVQVHFLTDFAGSNAAIAGLELRGLDPGACDGQPVKVTLSGNNAGDPAQAPTRMLSVLDSSLEPCTGAKASTPKVVAGGRIALHGCPTVSTPSGAAYADMHDATRLTVEVAGRGIPIGGGPNVLGPPTIDGGGPDGDGGGPDGSDTGDESEDTEPQVLGVEQFADAPSSGQAEVPTAVAAGGLLADTGGPRTLMLWLGVLLVLFGVLSLLRDLAKPDRRT